MTFLSALACKNDSRPPVWLMRQAGRYLPEYGKLRKKYSLWQMFHEPELSYQVTSMPIDILGVDAAILFSDILVIVEALGLELAFPEGVGPVVTPSLQRPEDVENLRLYSAEETLGYVRKSIEMFKKNSSSPLIGFCGGPFTVASYMIERGERGNLSKTKQWLYSHPQNFHLLLSKLTKVTIDYLKMQIDAGVQAIQIFDSWAQVLSSAHLVEFCLSYLKEIIAFVKSQNIPVLIFTRGSSYFPELLASLQPNAISFDWHREMAVLRKIVPSHIAVQGNLDPDLLKTKPEIVRKATLRILESMSGEPGFIFNLGHGVLPQTPVENVQALIETVKTFSPTSKGGHRAEDRLGVSV